MTPNERRAPAAHSQTTTPKAARTYAAPHLVPHASPKHTPATISHGRNHNTGPHDVDDSARRANRSRTQSRSFTQAATAQRMKNASKMSSRASRDSTSCRPSKQSSRPATQPSIVEPVSRRASRHITRTMSEPITAAETRQPNGSIPNAFSPSAISHLPTSGCTVIDGSLSHRPLVVPPRIFSLTLSPSGRYARV